MVRVVCISDTHGYHRQIGNLPMGDILVHAGDFTFFGKTLKQLEKQDFHTWLAEQPHPYKILVAGNHEECLDPVLSKDAAAALAWLISRPGFRPLPPAGQEASPGCYYLDNQAISVLGLRLYGAPEQPDYGHMGFNRSHKELLAIWDRVPADVQLLVTHGPPFGVLDEMAAGPHFSGKSNEGCRALAQRIRRLRDLRLHVFGHIHPAYGVKEGDRINDQVTFVNAALANRDHRPVVPPIVIDVPEDRAARWRQVK